MSMNKTILETFAALAHESWAGWTRYMLKCLDSPEREEHIARWKRQMDTPYEYLSEKEKDSDRAEAKKYLSVVFQMLTNWIDENQRFSVT